jgi:membrane protease YdiL (CAAX protease family)
MDIAISQTVAPSSTRRFSLTSILVLHLAPGIAITLAFITLARLAVPLGWPPSLALLLTWLVVGVPILIGILFYHGRQLNGTLSLNGILLYRQPLPWRQYAWLVPILLVWTALASTLLFSLGESLRLSLFAGWPNWLNLSALAQAPTQYSSAILWMIVALSAVLNIAVPITEELYFRSFLLPRLPVSPRWAPLLSTVLFSLYHLWLPWDIIGRIITLLPVVYVVQWKRNVYVSILVHCLLNLIGTIGLAAVIMGGSR